MIAGKLREQLAPVAERAGIGSALEMLSAEALECAYLFEVGDGRPPADLVRRRGGSRVGGRPDLPKGAEWPAGLNDKGKPWGYAGFLAQIDLADVPRIAGLSLPRRGHLWLFVPSWGKGGLKLATVFDPDPGTLTRRPEPPQGKLTGPFTRLRPTPVRFRRGVSLPFYSRSFEDALAAAVGGRGSDQYPGLLALYAVAPKGQRGQVGGHSFVPDFDLRREIAFQRLGRPDYFWADRWDSLADYERCVAEGRAPPFLSEAQQAKFRAQDRAMRPQVEWIERHRAQLAAETEAWRLLVRFNAGLAGMNLGDGMYLEVFIREDDLAAGRFDRVVGQCPMLL